MANGLSTRSLTPQLPATPAKLLNNPNMQLAPKARQCRGARQMCYSPIMAVLPFPGDIMYRTLPTGLNVPAVTVTIANAVGARSHTCTQAGSWQQAGVPQEHPEQPPWTVLPRCIHARKADGRACCHTLLLA